MYRFALDYLKKWKDKPHRKPLIMRGARQVGKSYLARRLAKDCFEDFCELNFEKDTELKDLFKERTPQKILQLLEINRNKKISPGKTLLFLDEIQSAPEIIPALRYFFEDMPSLHVIAAGSLLEFILSEHDFSMPVGRVEYLYLGPMNFQEFLLAQGEDKKVRYLKSYQLDESIPIILHKQLIDQVKMFCFLGGMPQVLASYIEGKSEKSSPVSEQGELDGVMPICEEIKQSVLITYEEDFSKYRKKVDYALLQKVFKKIPQLIGSKTKYTHIDPHQRSKDLSYALDLLCMARVATRINHSSSNGVPLGAQVNERSFKMLFLDVGLMSRALGLSLLDYEKLKDIQLIHQGRISEQFIGQHLLYSKPFYQTPELFYWVREKKNSSAEIDYVSTNGSQVVPIEVKSGKTGRLKSLHLFLQEKGLKFALRFNNQPPSLLKTKTSIASKSPTPFTLLSLPFYLVGEWERLVEDQN